MTTSDPDTIKVAGRPTSLLPSDDTTRKPQRHNVASTNATERGRQSRSEQRPLHNTRLLQSPTTNTDKYQVALSNIAKVEAALDAPNGLTSLPPLLLRSLLAEAKAAFTALQQQSVGPPDIQRVFQEVQAVHRAIKDLPTPPQSPSPTWAQTVAAAAAASPTTPPRLPQQALTSEITIHFSDDKDKEAITKLPNEAIVQKIHQTHPVGREVVAAQRLPSGDVRLFLTGETVKQTLL